MVGGLGDDNHGLHARKSRAALDQARAGEAPRTRTEREERRHGRFALVDAGTSGTGNRRKPREHPLRARYASARCFRPPGASRTRGAAQRRGQVLDR
jgi:hypothetical protein